MSGTSDDDFIEKYFHEIPKQNAAIAAMVLYLVITLVVFGLTIKTRAWFMMTVALTGALETAGFACRVAFLQHPVRMEYIAMQCFLIISPVLLAIVEYICVGKLLQMSPAGRGTAFARWLARLFTISDFVCLMLQGGGGGLISSLNENSQRNGRNLLLAGLALQLMFFTMFTVVTLYVHLGPKFGFRGVKRLRHLFFCMYVTIALMYVRNIFRVVEFVQGFDGYLTTHEEYFYGFDFAPIFTCFLFFSVFHYGFYVNDNYPRELLDGDESTIVQPMEMVYVTPASVAKIVS